MKHWRIAAAVMAGVVSCLAPISIVTADASTSSSSSSSSTSKAVLPAPPYTPKEPAAIESFSPYQPQFFCRKTVMPGVKAFEKLVLSTYKNTHSDGDMRSCSVAGTSEHKDGRAFDWGADHRVAGQRKAGESMLKWLFATDANGNKDAMVRRLGLMYIIWNKRIWGAYDQRWEPYACSGVTDCHIDHMHFSFGWAGAEKKTSYWTKKVAGPAEPPLPKLKTNPHVLKVLATAGEVTAHYLLVGGADYDATASGTWKHDGKSADAVCEKTKSGWQQADQPLQIGGDELRSWGERWTPTTDTGGGCNTTNHTYQLTVSPQLLSTLTAELPDAGHGDSGSISVKVARQS